MFPNSIPRHQLSKSTFMYGAQCTKRIWLHKNLPKERDVQSESQARIFQRGTDIGLLAQRLFPDGISAEPENYYSYQKSVAETLRYIRNGHQVIYEAVFQFEGILCAVDILVKTNNKWYAYEVKSTNSVKPAHIQDAALQYYVITNAGIDLADFNIIHLNREYIRQGDLDIKLLFNPASVLKEVIGLQPFILSKSAELMEILSKNTPPEINIGEHCTIPYPCDFQSFCNKGRLPVTIKIEDVVNKKLLSGFSKNLKFPVSFLSMQTWSSAVPLFDGHWPYRQVCYQYSLHQLSESGGLLKHVYFLEDEVNARQKELILSLLKAAGEEGEILVHQDSFIKFHLQHGKKDFPDLEKQISSFQKRIVELIPPFAMDIFPEQETENDLLQEQSVNGFSIAERSSAAAAFLNMKSVNNSRKIAEMKEALFFYSQRSSLDLVKKFQRWRLF